MSKSLWKLVKYFLVSILMVGGIANGAVNVNNALQCAPRVQTTTATTVWKCPALPNFTTERLKVSLLDVDFRAGSYACKYTYEQSGDLAQICTHVSSFYKDESKKAQDIIKEKVNLFTPFDFNTDFNFLNAVGMSTMSTTMETNTNQLLVYLKDFRTSADNPNNTLAKTEADLAGIVTTITSSLIDPYIGLGTSKKDSNFALFLAGLVTLDSSVVQGYEEHSGKLLIASDWRNKATTVGVVETDILTQVENAIDTVVDTTSYWISSAWSALLGRVPPPATAKNSRTDLHGLPDGIKIASWIEVFEMKLWGFYYNLNRRFDIGFDVISTKILFMMFTWFVLFSGVRRGVGYLLNSDNSFRMTEEKWIKTLVILLSVVTFYVSVPSPITSTLDGESVTSSERSQEFYKNKTLAKGIIRMTASMGQHMGTMMSDLGLSAFLDFMIKKQNVHAGSEVSNMLISGLSPLPMYYPAYQVVNQCRGYYDASDADFLSDPAKMMKDGFKVVNGYTSPFFTGNGIEGLSIPLCHKAYLIVALSPPETAKTIAEVTTMIRDKDAIKAKSMKFIVLNMVAMQEKMGWINTFAVPISYFLFKNADMFLSKGMNSDSIAEVAEQYTDNITTTSSAIKQADVGADNTYGAGAFGRVGVTAVLDSTGRFFSDMFGGIMGMGVYNMLPGFSPIKESLNNYLENIYDAKLSIYLADKESTIGKLKEAIISLLKKIPYTKLFAVIGSAVNSTIESTVLWQTMITVVSYLVAIYIWKMALTTMLTALIGTMSLLKIVLYFKSLLVHTMTSLVYFLWAFANGNSQNKLTGFIKDTMILMFYPILIVSSLYIFIFEYELLSLLYTFIMAGMVEAQRTNISLMDMANNGDGSTMSAYFNTTMLLSLSEIVVQIFGIVLAYLTIMKLPETILRKMGISEGENSVGIGQDHETINSRGMDRVSNPMQ